MVDVYVRVFYYEHYSRSFFPFSLYLVFLSTVVIMRQQNTKFTQKKANKTNTQTYCLPITISFHHVPPLFLFNLFGYFFLDLFFLSCSYSLSIFSSIMSGKETVATLCNIFCIFPHIHQYLYLYVLCAYIPIATECELGAVRCYPLYYVITIILVDDGVCVCVYVYVLFCGRTFSRSTNLSLHSFVCTFRCMCLSLRRPLIRFHEIIFFLEFIRTLIAFCHYYRKLLSKYNEEENKYKEYKSEYTRNLPAFRQCIFCV